MDLVAEASGLSRVVHTSGILLLLGSLAANTCFLQWVEMTDSSASGSLDDPNEPALLTSGDTLFSSLVSAGSHLFIPVDSEKEALLNKLHVVHSVFWGDNSPSGAINLIPILVLDHGSLQHKEELWWILRTFAELYSNDADWEENLIVVWTLVPEHTSFQGIGASLQGKASIRKPNLASIPGC